MNLPSKNHGFTLIELLVVISIIGLLSSIVLAALNSAKLKAQDARLMSEMLNLRTAAEMYRVSNGLYCTNSCMTNGVSLSRTFLLTGFLNDPASGGQRLVADIVILSKTVLNTESEENASFAIIPTAFAVSARLPSTLTGTASYVCVDSTGVIKMQANPWGFSPSLFTCT